MFSFVLAILAVQAPEPPLGEDIVVVAERMKRVRVVTTTDKKTGQRRCIIRRTSGRALLDEAFCDATLACASVETKLDGMLSCMRTRMPAIAHRFTAPAATGTKLPDVTAKGF